MSELELARQKIREKEISRLRWRILSVLNTARPETLDERTIFAVAEGCGISVTQKELRKELDYLCKAHMVGIVGREKNLWVCDLTFEGINVVEGRVPCPIGILAEG